MEKTYRKFTARIEGGKINSTPAAWLSEWGYEEIYADDPLVNGHHIENYYEIALVSKETEAIGVATTTLPVWGDGGKEEELDVSGEKKREIKKYKYTLLPEWKHLVEFGLPEVEIQTLVSEYIQLAG